MSGPGYSVLASFLVYVGVLAWLRPLTPARRAVATIVPAADVLLLWWLSGTDTAAGRVVRDWMPAAQILLLYWLSGVFTGPPRARAEAWLLRWDRYLFQTLGLAAFVVRAPRIILEVLEAAYLSVYLVVPLGFAIVYFGAPDLDAARYWTVVVSAEVLCYATLPWLTTRPPRALGAHDEIDRRTLVLRRLNLSVLRVGSVQVNTVPSGHAAGAVATALMVAAYMPGPGLALCLLAAGIAISSVVGRYHYAADAVLGVLVALLVWMIA